MRGRGDEWEEGMEGRGGGGEGEGGGGEGREEGREERKEEAGGLVSYGESRVGWSKYMLASEGA